MRPRSSSSRPGLLGTDIADWPSDSGSITLAVVGRSAILLFDVDGTLLTCGGAGRAAMERAFEGHLGRADVGGFPYGGMTDRAIVRAATRAAGRDDDEATLDRLLAIYLANLADELGRAERFAVLPGVVALLDALDGHGRLAVGLGTGNLVDGARLKLARAGLWERFAFGGYGSDHEDRARLLEAGARRGAERLGLAREGARVVVIGDTPRDVAAGRAIGAEIVAVATGGYDAAALVGADLVVSRLDDPRVLAFVSG